MVLTLDDLWKTYHTSHGDVQASKGLSFKLDEGEVLALVGPSGCGKTTALRCVAGLEVPDSGSISVGGEVAYSSDLGVSVNPERRPVGMVFQSYAIWPHMTVFQNVSYPLMVSRPRPNAAIIRDRVQEALDRVRIGELASRRATMLSGGQQQRVAIARALVRGARVLLFDEPLSNLDAKLREEMRGELRSLFKSMGATVLYVTHDLGEALAISDRVIVLEGGTIAQEGTPEDIYFNPRSLFVAEFLGNANLVEAQATLVGDELRVSSAVATLYLPTPQASEAQGALTMLIRPEAFTLTRAQKHEATAVVETSMFLGSFVEYRIKTTDGMPLTARMPSYGDRLVAGTHVRIDVDPAGVSLIMPTATGSSTPVAPAPQVDVHALDNAREEQVAARTLALHSGSGRGFTQP